MHFYAEENGIVVPKHYVPMTKDPTKTRPSRTTDAKKAAKAGQVWYPSVTGIIGVLDKKNLVNWKIDQHLETVHDLINSNTELRADDFDGFKRMIRAKTEERMDLAPKAGTNVHKLLEDYLFMERPDHLTELDILIIENVEKALLEYCGEMNWERERHFIDSNYGYAGCADIYNEVWTVDYKSKQEAVKFKRGKMAYDDHARQLAAYGNALCKEDYRAANLFICLENGEVDFHEHEPKALSNGFEDFLDCLSLYNRNTYDPTKILN